jgi:hypothetical protein
MRDPSEIYTRQGTPIIVVVTRFAFLFYFLFALWSLKSDHFYFSNLQFVWLLYLLAIYFIAEKIYALFFKQGIDLTFAFPLLFSIYCLSLVGLLLGGQDRLPLLNRTEHFASFVLIAYILWIFFTKYLPQNVWHNHPYYISLLVLSVSSLFGVANEIVELVMDNMFNTNLIGASFDTSLDLLMNTLGSGLYLAVRLIVGESKPKQAV